MGMQSVQEAPGSWYGPVRQVHGQSTMFVQVLSQGPQGRVVLHHEITTFLLLPRFTSEPPSSLPASLHREPRSQESGLPSLPLWRRSLLMSRAFHYIFDLEHYHPLLSFCFPLSSYTIHLLY